MNRFPDNISCFMQYGIFIPASLSMLAVQDMRDAHLRLPHQVCYHRSVLEFLRHIISASAWLAWYYLHCSYIIIHDADFKSGKPILKCSIKSSINGSSFFLREQNGFGAAKTIPAFSHFLWSDFLILLTASLALQWGYDQTRACIFCKAREFDDNIRMQVYG